MQTVKCIVQRIVYLYFLSLLNCLTKRYNKTFYDFEFLIKFVFTELSLLLKNKKRV